VGGKEDERWQERGGELVRLRGSVIKTLDEVIENDGILDYKNRLCIRENENPSDRNSRRLSRLVSSGPLQIGKHD